MGRCDAMRCHHCQPTPKDPHPKTKKKKSNSLKNGVDPKRKTLKFFQKRGRDPLTTPHRTHPASHPKKPTVYWYVVRDDEDTKSWAECKPAVSEARASPGMQAPSPRVETSNQAPPCQSAGVCVCVRFAVRALCARHT